MQPNNARLLDICCAPAGIGAIVAIQLALAVGILILPDVLPFPPTRISIIVGAQLLLMLIVSWRNRIDRNRMVECAVLLGVLYVCAVFFVFSIKSTNVEVDPAIRVESVVSAVALVGFAGMNTALLVRVARARRPERESGAEHHS